MKKSISLLMISLLFLTLVACQTKKETTNTKDDSTITISVGMSADYPPYESLDTEGNLIGFDVEMLKEMEKLLSEKYDKNYKFNIVQMNFDNIITQIQGGQLNCGVSGFTWSEKREKAVSFSLPYCNSKQVVMLLADSQIDSLDALKDAKIAVQTGTTGEYAALDTFGEANIVSIQSVIDMIPGLDAFQYEAVVLDSAVANSYVATGKYKVLDEALIDEKNYIVVAKDDKEMLDIINEAITLFLASDKYLSLCEEYQLSPIDTK